MLNTPLLTAAGGLRAADRFIAWAARRLHRMQPYRNGVVRAFFLPATRRRGRAAVR